MQSRPGRKKTRVRRVGGAHRPCMRRMQGFACREQLARQTWFGKKKPLFSWEQGQSSEAGNETMAAAHEPQVDQP